MLNEEEIFTKIKIMDKLLQPIIDYYNTTGKVPGKRDINSNAILWHYKSWAKAVEAAGLKPRRVVQYTEEELINSLLRFSKENGFSPRAADCNTCNYLYDTRTYLHKLKVKTWGSVLEKAVLDKYFEFSRFVNLSDEELLNRIKKLLDISGSTSISAYERMNTELPSVNYLCHRYGSWSNLLKKAQLKMNVDKYDNEDLLETLHKAHEHFHHVPSSTELERFSGICPRIWTTRFGSYNEVLKLVGLTPAHLTPCDVVESDNELITMYMKFSEENGYINGATSRALDQSDDIYKSNVFEIRFGSLNNLRELCGYKKIVKGVSKYTEQEIRQGLSDLYKRYQRVPTLKEIKASDLPCISCILRYCKSTSIKEAVLKSINYDN